MTPRNSLQTPSPETLQEYEGRAVGDFRKDLDAHDNYITDFDAYEAMLLSKTYDSISKRTNSGLTDGRTTTIYDERAARVVGQLPDGVMRAAGKKDQGAAMLLDIIRQRWVYPNANAQAPFLEKIRNWQFYGSVYGYMMMFYDWDVVKSTSYVGPNCWLWSPRNFVPQLGRASIDDMDYSHGIVYVGRGYLQKVKDLPASAGWIDKEVDKLLNMVDNKTNFPDQKRQSFVIRTRQSQADRGRIMLATRYEAGDDGKWVTFAPEYANTVVRIIANPHKNGFIPFIAKYAKPLFDNFYGLGDFQRSRPLQSASDGLDAFYFAGIKRGLYPPTIINPAGVNKQTLTEEPGAKWEETIENSIREYSTNPTGLSTYQAAKQIMNGALLNLAGTTDTTVTQASSLDPGFGKTPQAVQALGQRESTRDNEDRFYLESSLETLIDRMMGLIPVIGTEKIPIDLFTDDIKTLVEQGYLTSSPEGVLGGDLAPLLDISQSGQSAKLRIDPNLFKDLSTRFHLDPGSTAMADKDTQLKNFQQFMNFLSQNQNNVQDLNKQGKTIDFAQAATIYGDLADIDELDKIIRPMTPQEQQAYEQSINPQITPKVGINLTGSLDPQETQEAATGQPITPPAQPPTVVHNGQPIQDPAVAQAYASMAQGGTPNGQ